jgi:REP element-mobilizing transposase RayT
VAFRKLILPSIALRDTALTNTIFQTRLAGPTLMPTDRDNPERKLHRLSAAVYAATDYEFHFTVCARHQGAPFTNRLLADKVIESLLWTKSKYQWLLYCYCLMPDHLHFVCRLTERDAKTMNAGARGSVAEGVLDHLGRFKSFTTTASWKLGCRGTLWQKSSYDRVFDMEKPFEEVVQYVLDNPVRKQLVADWTEWPYSRIVDPWWL